MMAASGNGNGWGGSDRGTGRDRRGETDGGPSPVAGDRLEIRLAGSGGQGLVLAGIILAEAAVMFDGINAVQSQSYGPEARGGASKSEVIIAPGEIDYPKCEGVDIFLALTQEAAKKYADDIKPGGTVVVDEELVPEPPEGDFRVIRLPLVKTAREDVGKAFVANIVSLGAIVGFTDVVTEDAITQAVLRRVPKGTEELNKKALAAGFALAKAAAG
jgi:2-oxoglutarate ferredoxin oxidoreductase subunit gamma